MTNLSSLAGFSAGGSGGSSNPDFFANNGAHVANSQINLAVSGYNDSVSYEYTMGLFPAATTTGNIKDRNVFGIWRQWADSVAGASGFSITSFEVNKTTGAVTVLQGGPQAVWTNTSGSAHSTTYLTYDPNWGCFFSAGNNAYPGHSSHVMGYTAGQLDSSGAVQGATNAYTNGDHGYNNTWCGCLQQGTTNYFMTAGYTGSYASYRVHTATSSGITIGTLVQPATWTSSTHGWQHITQPDVATVPTDETVSAVGMSFNSPDYGWAVAKQGGGAAAAQFNRALGYQTGNVWTGYNGTKSLLEQTQDYGTLDASNNFTSLTDGERDLDYLTSPSAALTTHGVGDNKFMYVGDASPSKGYDLFKLDSNNNPVHLQTFKTVDDSAPSILDNPTSNTNSRFFVYENNTDSTPKWLVTLMRTATDSCIVYTQEITADFTQYN